MIRHLGLLAATSMFALACPEQPINRSSATPPQASTPSSHQTPFVEVTSTVGLDFHHFNGMTGELYIVEMMGGGGALFDYDHDGDLDLYLRQGGLLAKEAPRSAEFSDRLFRNDLREAENGQVTMTLVDVSKRAGIEDFGYGMGIATGDYDNDGWTDLYLTNFGPNYLLRNRGDGSFVDVTKATRTEDARWSVPALFADFDGDGWADLYVGNYIDFTLINHRACRRASSAPDYCGPMSYEAEPDRMFRNKGDGTFEDVTLAVGMAIGYGSALGALTGDFDQNGRLDLFVANDAMENQLWLGAPGGRFVDEALSRGCATNGRGEREGSMGVTAGDFDLDGDEDLFVSHMATESNTLYVNEDNGQFRDGSLLAGLATASQPFTGFGTMLFDFDMDGFEDILVVNGAVRIVEELEAMGDPFPLHQTNQLFRNRGDGTFEDISAASGSLTEISEVSRGAIFGDLDNDGDIDVVIVNNNGPARLFLNNTAGATPWIGMTDGPQSAASSPQGDWFEMAGATDLLVNRRARTTASYASANDPRTVLALPPGDSTATLRRRRIGASTAIEFQSSRPGYYYSLPSDRSAALERK